MSEVDAKEKRKRDFERSLAGPSVGKAGECLVDQAEFRSRARSDGYVELRPC